MHCAALVKVARLRGLAHGNDNRRHAAKQRIPRSLVRLPCREEVTETFLEEVLVNLDFGHGDDGSGKVMRC